MPGAWVIWVDITEGNVNWALRNGRICLFGGPEEAFTGVFHLLGNVTLFKSICLPSFLLWHCL